jgi:putative transposase
VVSALHVHFVTTYRRNVLDTDMLQSCQDAMPKVRGDFSAELPEFNGDDDHTHLLVQYPSKVAVPAPVNSLKGVPAREPRPEATGPVNRHITHGHSWSPSSFAASRGGAPLSIIRQHIDQERTPAHATSGLTPEGRGSRPAISVIPRAGGAG